MTTQSTKTAHIFRTAKYFGISVAAAARMIEAVGKNNQKLRARGDALADRIKSGKPVRYVSR